MSVSVAERIEVQGGSSAFSFRSCRKVNAEPSRISAEIVKIGKTPLPKLRDSIREDFKRMFWLAFDGASLNAKANDAARKIRGVSADTFARIYSDETAKVDFALALAVAAIYQTRPGAAPAQFAGLIIRATIGEVA
jgi:hypothetical protein